MSKIDKIKEQKSDFKEVFKVLLYAILGLLTGISTIIYKIFAGKIPSYTIVLGILALIIVFLIAIYASILWKKMQELNEEMENVG